MPPRKKQEQAQGLEASLWEAADRLRSNMDAAEYKHVVLGLIFLKYVSDVFARRQRRPGSGGQRPGLRLLHADRGSPAVDPRVPRRVHLRRRLLDPGGAPLGRPAQAPPSSPTSVQRIDAAMDAIEKENPTLRACCRRTTPARELTPATLGGLIDTFSREDLAAEEHEGLDVLGRVFEYIVGQFASAEGKLGGEFYTPRSVVQLMVEMLEPFNGRVFDPACGSGGMFVQADRFVKAHGGVRNDISVFGQEQNPTTWRLAKMNLALRGIDANLGPQWGDSFAQRPAPGPARRLHPRQPAVQHLRVGRREAARRPPLEVRHPAGGQRQLRLDPAHAAPPRPDRHDGDRPGQRVAVVASSPARARSARTSSRPTSSSASSRCRPSCSTRPASRSACGSSPRTRPTARSRANAPSATATVRCCSSTPASSGHMVTRTVRELTDEDIAKIADTYHAWRGEPDHPAATTTSPASAPAVTLDVVREHDYVLTPGRYVGSEDAEMTANRSTRRSPA